MRHDKKPVLKYLKILGLKTKDLKSSYMRSLIILNQTSENSTNPENADLVDDSGDKLQNSSIENEEIRSERIKDRAKISYRLMEKYLFYAYVCFNDIPSTFEEIKHRDDRVFWEKAVCYELDSHLQK